MAKAIVVGTGSMGQHHARIYNELGILGGIVDTDPARAAEIARKYMVPFTDNLDGFFTLDSGVTHASVAVPTPVHAQVAMSLLEHGVDILLEKPMAPSVDDARAINIFAMRQCRTLAVGYIETFNPAFVALKRLVAEGFFGEITSVSVKRVGGEPRSADNVITDLMTHDFGLLLDLFDRTPTDIQVNQRTSNGIVDSAHVLLQFGNASAICEANWVSPIKVRQIVVTGTTGYCEVDLIAQSLTRHEDPARAGGHRVVYGQPQRVTIERYNVEPLKAEICGFVDKTMGLDTGSIVSGDRGVKILEVTLAAAELGQTNEYFHRLASR